jgi:uncharacterized protein (TIGR04255 family)
MGKSSNLIAPFGGPPPKEIPLKRAPLARVVVQIKFPLLASVSDPRSVAPFQDLIRSAYPIGNKEIVQRLEINPEIAQATVKSEPENVWRFQDQTKQWRVSLAPNFLALETTRYESRKDFLTRTAFLIDALERTFNPQLTERVGLRYIDRLEGNAVNKVHQLIRKEVLGSYLLFGPAVRHILAVGEFETEEGATLTARWCLLPAGGAIPNVLEAAPDKSWILDLDMFTTKEGSFTAVTLTELLNRFAERIYTVFRYMITDQFLDHYGRQK